MADSTRNERILAILGQIDLAGFFRLLDERHRAGLPARSMGDGIRTGEHSQAIYGGGQDDEGRKMPESLFDPYDQTLQDTRAKVKKLYRLVEQYRVEKNLGGVERELGKIHNLVQSVTAIHIPKPEDDAIPCANVACVPTPEFPDRGFLTEKDLREGRKHSECARCRVWRSTYKLAFPNKLQVGEIHAENGAA